MPWKCFAEAEVGPTGKPSEAGVALSNGDRGGQGEQGLRLCCRVNSVTALQKGDICLFIFSVFTMLCLPLF